MEGVDKSNLKKIIINSPGQLKANLEWKYFILCGVGGSSITVNLFHYLELNRYLPLTITTPLYPHHDYDLPPDADANSLIICASYSGNTEETISSYKKARELGLEIAGLTCGGQLADLFQQNKIPWIKIPDKTIPPRHGLGYQMAALVKLFIAYGFLLHTAQDSLNEAADKIQPIEIEKEVEPLIQ
ncbi:MAG: Bifunctional phosphoglucose/phosphomannose isomerase, partial [Parcubacteria group bacterium GW2011_GWC2_42_6]